LVEGSELPVGLQQVIVLLVDHPLEPGLLRIAISHLKVEQVSL
jgi:hypothetical protein